MSSNKIAVGILIAGILGACFVVFSGKESSNVSKDSRNNVVMENGKQIIEITAKGGYLPENSQAKAGVSTILRVSTRGTFDCSSAFRIPSMRISKNLPPTGVIEIDLGVQPAGTLAGSCGMGMYPFSITFK